MSTGGIPPGLTPFRRAGRKSGLPVVALGMAAVGLVISLLLALLVGLGVIPVPWDATVLPGATLAGLMPFCAISFLVACVSLSIHRDARSIVAVLIALVAVVASLGASFLIIGTAIANHPI